MLEGYVTILQPIVAVFSFFQELMCLVKKKSMKFGKHCRGSMCAHLATNGRPSLSPSTSPFFQVLQVKLLNSTASYHTLKVTRLIMSHLPSLTGNCSGTESREFVNWYYPFNNTTVKTHIKISIPHITLLVLFSKQRY